MFVHDFVQVDRPFPAVLALMADLLGAGVEDLVHEAWKVDCRMWCDTYDLESDEVSLSSQIRVEVGPPRSRLEAVVVPLRWAQPKARLVPAVEADLEIAALGSLRSDLHILGRYDLGADVDMEPHDAQIAHRVTVSAMRRLLQLLKQRLEQWPAAEVAVLTEQTRRSDISAGQSDEFRARGASRENGIEPGAENER